MRDLCHLNGRLLPVAEARIDPWDRGFLFGDALYEVIKVREGTLLDLDAHLARLAGGLARVAIPEPEGMAGRCLDLVRESVLRDGSLYLQVTRGVAARSHLPPVSLEPTVLLLPTEGGHNPPAGDPRRAVTLPDPRWRHRDLKTTSLMASVLGKLHARDRGVEEVLFLGPDDDLREGGNTTFFARRDNALETHPLGDPILPGVTRGILLELCAELELPIRERSPRLGERDEWQEAFLCGTLTGVQPLVELDGRPVVRGEWTLHLAEALEERESRLVAAVNDSSGRRGSRSGDPQSR